LLETRTVEGSTLLPAPGSWPRRRTAFATGLALAAALAAAYPAAGQGQGQGQGEGQGGAKPPEPAGSLFDPRLAELRRASVTWESRDEADRKVVDVLCLVPDVPAFLEALGAWDRGHFFPILLDEPEAVLRFARAFRPARVVRYPGRPRPIPPEEAWGAAATAAGRSWVGGEDREADGRRAGPTTPGVVLAAPGCPSLAGAAALAAGRLQPLVRWDPPRRRADVLPADEADRLATDLEAKVAAAAPRYNRLGDDCDFLTLAGDYPDRYLSRIKQFPGPAAFDDLVGRAPDGVRRWAFAGRLGGDPAASVYRAMCSLFLRPHSALLFNGYDEASEPWKAYAMPAAADRLGRELKVTHRSGPAGAGVAAWHKAFGAVGGFDLALINTSGSPAAFTIQGQQGHTGDVPMTVPAAVLMIHSFSAADPADPATLAGRWLANGAFVYFGAMNEPYVNAFRTPTLVADLIAGGLPFAAAVRLTVAESPFGIPWRLHYLGDPLYRLRRPAPRVAATPAVAAWPESRPGPRPPARAGAAERLNWAYAVALAPPKESAGIDLPAELLAIPRASLAPALRPRHDALLADTLFAAGRPEVLARRLGQIPPQDASPDVRRWLETARVAALHADLADGRWGPALSTWDALIRSESPPELKALLTARVGALATTPERRRAWADRLRPTIQALGPRTPAAAELEKELLRVE